MNAFPLAAGHRGAEHQAGRSRMVKPERDRELGGHPPGHLVSQAGAERQAAHQRQQPQAAAHRVHAEDGLEELGRREQQAEHREDAERLQDGPPGEPGRPEQPEIHERLPAGRLVRRSSHATKAASTATPPDHRGDRRRRGPAVLPGRDETVDQRGQAAARGHDPHRVQAGAAGGTRLRHQHHDRDQADHHHRDVQQEHPAPPVVGQQPAAEDRADRQGQEVGRRPGADRLGPLLRR